MNMDQFVLAAKSIEADHLPLLSACDDVLAFISKTKDNLPPEHAAKVAEMLEGLQTYRADFIRETGGELARLKASIAQSAEEIAAASAEFDAEHAKATQTFADLEQNMPAMLAAAAEAAKAAVPVVEAPAIPALHPGEDLIAQLMSMRMPGQKAPSGVRSAGNIWENWKPGAGGT